jgi:acyl-CoA thioesterase-2
MPDAPDPESLPTMLERASSAAEVPREERGWMERERSVDMRHVDVTEYLSYDDKSPENLVWLRAKGALPDDPLVHQSVVAYFSDMTIIDTAIRPHTKHFSQGEMMVASLDHAIWFHRPFRADEWLLYVQESDSMSNGRGIARAKLFRRDGGLACSVVQEGLIRLRRKPPSD